MPLHVSSTCAHHQEVKIVLHSLWYHHTYRWPSLARVPVFLSHFEHANKITGRNTHLERQTEGKEISLIF